MPGDDKIGSDVLGQGGGLPQSSMKRQEMLKKMREEQAKKKKALGRVDDIEGHEVHGDMPSDQHDRKLGEHGYDQVEKDVHVSEHKRGRPKRKTDPVNSFFYKQADKIEGK